MYHDNYISEIFNWYRLLIFYLPLVAAIAISIILIRFVIDKNSTFKQRLWKYLTASGLLIFIIHMVILSIHYSYSSMIEYYETYQHIDYYWDIDKAIIYIILASLAFISYIVLFCTVFQSKERLEYVKEINKLRKRENSLRKEYRKIKVQAKIDEMQKFIDENKKK